MFNMRSFLALALSSLILAGCNSAEGERDARPSGAAADITSARESTSADTEGETLHVIMQGLEGKMVGLMHSLWREDYDGVAERAAALADHPEIAPAEEERIERILGEDMAGFEEADEVVHEASIRLSEAAKRRDMAAVLRELNAVQSGCVACHAQFRDRLHTAH